MAISSKAIKTRIKSVRNTKKMTKAMELVAASKMRKAINNVLATRSYSESAWEILTRLKNKTSPSMHKLLQSPRVLGTKINNVLIILLTSNRGLCGGYNAQIINKTIKSCQQHDQHVKTDFILIGKKGGVMAHKLKHKVIAYFDKEDVINQINEIYPISKLIFQEYLGDKYDKVLIAYTDFVSTLKQVPRVRQILPLIDKDPYIGEIETPQAKKTSESEKPVKSNYNFEYIFEPTADKVLEHLIPRLIEVQLYQAYLEANASEHSARMMAMKNASSAAEDMIADLTLSFNQSRQAAITREIAEISAGKAVLE